MIEVLNRQRKVRIDTSALSEFAERACVIVEEAEGGSATVVIVSDKRIRSLNAEFRGKDSATDVLSFPFGDEVEEGKFLGDIVISAETAERQASENGLPFETELRQLVLHGILHLCGFDHETDEGEMDALEMKYRLELGIAG
ncbi:MAG: rRNA maturation RNase YbeY [Acidobacteriota bacterium]|nr:MAG: rRNA maturation RNase YbeY [Acidobacteriota bacterium]